MAAALPIIVRLKMAAAAKVDFGLDMLVSPEFEQRSDNPSGNRRVSDPHVAKCHIMRSHCALQQQRTNFNFLHSRRSQAPGRNINVKLFVTDLIPPSGTGAEPKSVLPARCSKMLAIGFSPRALART
jgi:hypothetical protein